MEKLIYLYLNTCYPDAYLLKSKFGYVLFNMDKAAHFVTDNDIRFVVMRKPVVDRLVTLFSCSESDAELVYHNWFYSLPTYVKVNNATNETVLVKFESEYHTTV